MVSIESQVTSEKKWDLSFLMEMLTEAQEMNDDTQVRIIAKRALEQAKKQGNEQWEGKFQASLDKYSSNVKFDETSYKESEEGNYLALNPISIKNIQQLKILLNLDLKTR